MGTTFQMFNNFTSGAVGGFAAVAFGNPVSPTNLDQKYTSLSANAGRLFGDHNLKFGWNFLRTVVDGNESLIQNMQLFATVDDFVRFGPPNAGFFTVTTAAGLDPRANEIHLRNNYNGLFAQDDLRFRHNLTLNFGVRWDYDSEFRSKDSISPRIGFAWQATPKTVIRGHGGKFYDQFRLGLARDVPSFGGADQKSRPTVFISKRILWRLRLLLRRHIGASLFVGGLCVSPNLTDAEITASGCEVSGLRRRTSKPIHWPRSTQPGRGRRACSDPG